MKTPLPLLLISLFFSLATIGLLKVERRRRKRSRRRR
jgi:hypothetical protein